MTEFPPNCMDYVLSTAPGRRTKRLYIRIDGELFNIYREHGYGTDYARLFLLRALKREFGEKLHIHIVKASTARRVPEPKRTIQQLRKERYASEDAGFDWQPPGPLDEISNPNVSIESAHE